MTEHVSSEYSTSDNSTDPAVAPASTPPVESSSAQEISIPTKEALNDGLAEAFPDIGNSYLFGDAKYDRDRILAQARLFSAYLINNARRFVPGSPGDILDLGCSEGVLTFALSRAFPNARIVGVDRDAGAIELAKKRQLQLPTTLGKGHTEFVEGDIEKGLPPGKFDLIYASFVLLHLAQPEQVLRMCWESLKPGGIIWIKEVHQDSTRDVKHPAWIKLLDLIDQTMAKLGRNLYIGPRLPEMLKAANFTDIKINQERYIINDATFSGHVVTSVLLSGFYNARSMITKVQNMPEQEVVDLHKQLLADLSQLRGNVMLLNILATRPQEQTNQQGQQTKSPS